MTYQLQPEPFPAANGPVMTTISQLAVLTAHLHCPPGSIAPLLYAGHFGDLVHALSLDSRLRGSVLHAGLLDVLLPQAAAFHLPEYLLQRPDVLAGCMQRLAC